jgi:hypothetical protein
MTLTTLITLNTVIGAVLAYGLHHLLAHGIRSDRVHRGLHSHETVEPTSHESERIAA